MWWPPPQKHRWQHLPASLCALRLCVTVHTSPVQPCLLPLLYMNLLLDLGLCACLLSWGGHQLSSTTNIGLPRQIKSFTLIKFFPDERRQRNHASASLYSFCPNSVSHLWVMGLPVTLAHSCSTDASTRQADKKKRRGIDKQTNKKRFSKERLTLASFSWQSSFLIMIFSF